MGAPLKAFHFRSQFFGLFIRPSFFFQFLFFFFAFPYSDYFGEFPARQTLLLAVDFRSLRAVADLMNFLSCDQIGLSFGWARTVDRLSQFLVCIISACHPVLVSSICKTTKRRRWRKCHQNNASSRRL